MLGRGPGCPDAAGCGAPRRAVRPDRALRKAGGLGPRPDLLQGAYSDRQQRARSVGLGSCPEADGRWSGPDRVVGIGRLPADRVARGIRRVRTANRTQDCTTSSRGGPRMIAPIRVGVIGAGFIGPAHIESLRRLGYVEVVALAGSSQESAERKAADQIGRAS